MHNQENIHIYIFLSFSVHDFIYIYTHTIYIVYITFILYILYLYCIYYIYTHTHSKGLLLSELLKEVFFLSIF